MKIITLRLLILVLAISCPLSSVYAGNENGQEVGDVVFRTLHWAARWDKHSSIYCGYTNGDPEDNHNHYVVENEGPDVNDDVRSITFYQFKHQFFSARYYGSKGYSSLDEEKREIIRRTAVGFVGKINYTSSYTKKCIDWEDGIGGPKDGKLQFDEIIGLRSDAFVEYVYALNGKIISHDILNDPYWFNIISEDTLITDFTPDKQYNNMPDATVEDPTKVKSLKSTTHGDKIGKWSNKPDVKVTWEPADDTHSGIKRYFTRWSKLSGTIPTHTDLDSPETTLYDGQWYFHIRSVDNAGNWNENGGGIYSTAHLGPICIDTLPPFAVTTLASSRKVSTWSNNPKITTMWTAAEDDDTFPDGISGIGGYGAVWNTTAVSLPPEKKTIEAVTAATNETALPDGKSHYFHIRSIDKAGNWGKEAVHMGPFWVDATKPNISIAVLWEEKDSKKLYVIGRCFRVDVSDPIVNDARSC